MGINKIKKNGFKILSTTSRANHRDIPLREIFSKSQSEPGEAFYFFIPQIANDKNQYTYVYDTKLDRLLFFPKHKKLISKIEGQEIDLNKDWVKFTLDGRHIVLPRKLMVEEAAQKEWERGNFLPQDYVPDDLVRIHQKWNFHTPEYPKYLRGYVERYLYLRAISRSGRNQNFDSTKEGQWLRENAPTSGFTICQLASLRFTL